MDMNFLKKEYKAITPPDELGFVVASAKAKARRKTSHPVRYGVVVASVLLICALNLSPAFATGFSKIPLLGGVARVLTLRSYMEETPSHILNAQVPRVEDENNPALAQRINIEIQEKMDGMIKFAKEDAELYYDAYIATGGEAADTPMVAITVGYDIKCSNETFLSFDVYEMHAIASTSVTRKYFNIDLRTGADITLQDVVGEDYISIVSTEVEKQMKERTEAAGEELFFPVELGGFTQIRPDQSFYINIENKPVVVFDKYEIAAGAFGEQEFILEGYTVK